MKAVLPTPATSTKSTSTSQPFFTRKPATGFLATSEAQPAFFSRAAGHTAQAQPILQTKPSTAQAADRYEREADAVADKVVQNWSDSGVATPVTTGAPVANFISSISPLVQAKCADCEEEEKKQVPVQGKCAACQKEEASLVQAKPEQAAGASVPPSLAGGLPAGKGSGMSLPVQHRKQLEASFGADFSAVRLHTDPAAVQMSRALGAQAFTQGSDIYFNSGKYDTGSAAGRHLLAHELTHVVQQSKGSQAGIQRLGDLSKVPPMACDVANSSSVGTWAHSSLFATSQTTLSADQRHDIALLAASWTASGGTDTFRVDGYASTSGADAFNWRLSCDRAISVAAELSLNGVPDAFIEIFAQGETTEFGPPANNQRADITLIPAPVPPQINSETVVTGPGSRARTTIGVGEEVNLTHSIGGPSTTWTATAGTLSALTGARVLFTAPDTAQSVTITAAGATITFTIIAPTGVHMDNVGAAVKHTNNFPDSGILLDVFLLPDNVNFNKVTYRELDVPAVVTPGAYSCNPGSGGHCSPAGLAPCGDKALTNVVVSGKGTKSVLGDCAYSGHCGGSPPFAPGSLTLSIPYEYKVGTGSFRRITTVTQVHNLAADGSTLSSSKAGGSGSTTVVAPTATIPSCP